MYGTTMKKKILFRGLIKTDGTFRFWHNRTEVTHNIWTLTYFYHLSTWWLFI